MTTELFDNFDKRFGARGDLLRPKVGLWDSCDPVAHALLDLIEAQDKLADLFDEAASYGVEDEDTKFRAVIIERHIAGRNLMATLADRDRWPDPNLGK